MNAEINIKISNATKWSTITEVVSKLIQPITNMILARLLSPEIFGVVATITMVISFAEIFADAGFQKFLIQHEFKNNKEKYDSTTVAFWTNLFISLVLWIIIFVLRESIASVVGNPGLGNVIAIACITLPLTSLSSIQMALYRRDFDYKTLFYARIISICIPFIITIPLALILRSYWAIIIGTICGNFSNAIILTIKSDWKPKLFFRLSILAEMLSFSFWTLIETISIWLTSYIGTFIVGSYLSSYYLGIYKTSMTTVNQIMAIITGATTSVLFSALSRFQSNETAYLGMFFRFQRLVALFVLPMGVGIFMYQDLITSILLGSQWKEAANFIGLWGLMSALTIVFGHYSSEVYRSKGKPKLSFLVQVIHLIVLIPTLLISVKYGFKVLYITRSLVRIQLIITHMIIMYVVIKISPWKMLRNVFPMIFSSVTMGGIAYLLQHINSGFLWDFVSIAICIIYYFCCIMLFPRPRFELMEFIKRRFDKKTVVL